MDDIARTVKFFANPDDDVTVWRMDEEKGG